MTGARDRLAGTLGDGTTRRVGAVVAGTGEIAGLMAVVKRRKRSVRVRNVSSPTVTKGAAGSGLYSARLGSWWKGWLYPPRRVWE